jgi:IclR family acetate operon transcriptional repressor
VDDCENQPDGRCVAVALDGLPLLSGISVSAPANRLAAERVAEVAGQLRAVATELVEEYLARTTHTW